MKKLLAIGLTCMLCITPVSAKEGEMGYFGGISTGTKMPTLTSLLQTKKASSTTRYSLPYKEVVYLSGTPEVVEGTITINTGKGVEKNKGAGKYNESYTIKAQNKEDTASITRSITFTTEYIYEEDKKQTTKTSTVTKWSEVVRAGGQTYQLKSNESHYSKSILEHYAPGVTYYRGDVDYTAVYAQDDSEVTMMVEGPIYGYDQAFAKTETQKRTITIDLGTNGDGYTVYETPTVTAYKDIIYGANEPDAISFGGNYKEIIRNEGVVSYQIDNPYLYDDEKIGMINIESSPTIEQLSVMEIGSIKGHPAQTDISKVYSMKIFTDEPASFSANQVVTRQEYIAMLVRALQMPLPEPTRKSKKTVVEPSPFTDVKEGDTYYPYAKAAYDAGLISGGRLYGKSYLTRESMYVLNIRALGLERLGIGTGGVYTPFIDDGNISSWAKSTVYAASKIGLVPANNGYIFPTKKVTKAEAATFLNQYINYLRYDLQKDYSEKMLFN